MKDLNQAVADANRALIEAESPFRLFWSGVINHGSAEYTQGDYFIIWVSINAMQDTARLWMKAPFHRIIKELKDVVNFPGSVKFGYTKFWVSEKVIPDCSLDKEEDKELC